ncbi:MAG TPA: hypothetical protein VK564_10775 [Thermodesulfobacteriota bacterium]|nr:hypothetical protein [Thermodesulfobacteriota bacterium]
MGKIKKLILGVLLIFWIGAVALAAERLEPCPGSSSPTPPSTESQKAASGQPINQSEPQENTGIKNSPQEVLVPSLMNRSDQKKDEG